MSDQQRDRNAHERKSPQTEYRLVLDADIPADEVAEVLSNGGFRLDKFSIDRLGQINTNND